MSWSGGLLRPSAASRRPPARPARGVAPARPRLGGGAQAHLQLQLGDLLDLAADLLLKLGVDLVVGVEDSSLAAGARAKLVVVVIILVVVRLVAEVEVVVIVNRGAAGGRGLAVGSATGAGKRPGRGCGRRDGLVEVLEVVVEVVGGLDVEVVDGRSLDLGLAALAAAAPSAAAALGAVAGPFRGLVARLRGRLRARHRRHPGCRRRPGDGGRPGARGSGSDASLLWRGT